MNIVTKSTINEKAPFSILSVARPLDNIGIVEACEKILKPQQIIALLTFSLFGLDVLPHIDAKRIYQSSINEPLKKIKQEMQLMFTPDINGSIKNEVYKNGVAEYKTDLNDCADDKDVISFSSVLKTKELISVYNTLETEPVEKFILMHNDNDITVTEIGVVYGYESCGLVHLFHDILNGKAVSYIKVYLKPLQLIVLKNYKP